ncbi:MAG TPA: phosphoenolpyruvate carboxykinase (ATP) [Chthoniobacterales bacterium]|nr:phosphoenolpyruvate carboxykinase (ATP) [Chthoniobacterales bacterium]
MSSFTLKQHEITVNQIHRNLPPSALYEHAILHEKDAHIAENGALVEALRFGAVLENVVLDQDLLVDYTNISITENTRGAYPIQFIQNAKIPCVAGHPTDIIFLTCDAFGVLPPVSSLSPAQAMYHYISGYTAKVGWSGGAHGTGKRIKLANTRAIIDAIHGGALAKAATDRDPLFGLDVVTGCPNVPSEILIPRNVWSDKAAYEATAKKLAGLFTTNFAAFEEGGERRS